MYICNVCVQTAHSVTSACAAGRPGARGWRRMLSEGATRPGAGPELVEAALEQVVQVAA